MVYFESGLFRHHSFVHFHSYFSIQWLFVVRRKCARERRPAYRPQSRKYLFTTVSPPVSEIVQYVRYLLYFRLLSQQLIRNRAAPADACVRYGNADYAKQWIICLLCVLFDCLKNLRGAHLLRSANKLM